MWKKESYVWGGRKVMCGEETKTKILGDRFQDFFHIFQCFYFVLPVDP